MTGSVALPTFTTPLAETFHTADDESGSAVNDWVTIDTERPREQLHALFELCRLRNVLGDVCIILGVLRASSHLGVESNPHDAVNVNT
jgi:hypothetical protein